MVALRCSVKMSYRFLPIFLRLIPRKILKTPAVINAKAVIYTMLKPAKIGLNSSKNENKRVIMLQNNNQSQPRVPKDFN